MAKLDEFPEFSPADLSAWRDWLRANHHRLPGVWVVYFKRNSGKQGLRYSDAVDEALCWGWIDSKAQKLDRERYRQVFTPRKPRSVWSAVNKRKLLQLEADGRLQPAGLAAIALAKQNGSWEALDAVEALEYPADLISLFARQPELEKQFSALAASKRKGLLFWIYSAKRPLTREARIRALEATLPSGKLPGPFATSATNRTVPPKPLPR